MSTITTVREYKGKSLTEFPDDYVIIDLETTGLSSKNNEILEVGAIKVCANEIMSTFQSLIKPKTSISCHISNLNGITNEMVADAKQVKEVLTSFISYTGDTILIGHNVNFDINFLYDHCAAQLGHFLNNDFIDTMRLFMKTQILVENYKLMTLCEKCEIQNNNAHRALSDCYATNSLFQYLKLFQGPLERIKEADFLSLTAAIDTRHPLYKKNCLCPEENSVDLFQNFDTGHPLYEQVCVFTGALSISRNELKQRINGVGGIYSERVTRITHYLIVGSFEFETRLKGEKSTKILKAEKYILNGQNLEILSGEEFFELLNTK